MSKKTRSNVKKVLVRNPSIPVGSRKVVNCEKLKKVRFVEDSPEPSQENGLTSPEFCTLLQLADEMKKIRNTHRSCCSLPEVPRYRNLDFLPEEKVFKDLIDLELPNEQSVSGSKSQPCARATLKKDPEPDASKYLKYTLKPGYLFPAYAIPVLKKEETVFDGRSIYNKVKMWSEKIE